MNKNDLNKMESKGEPKEYEVAYTRVIDGAETGHRSRLYVHVSDEKEAVDKLKFAMSYGRTLAVLNESPDSITVRQNDSVIEFKNIEAKLYIPSAEAQARLDFIEFRAEALAHREYIVCFAVDSNKNGGDRRVSYVYCDALCDDPIRGAMKEIMDVYRSGSDGAAGFVLEGKAIMAAENPADVLTSLEGTPQELIVKYKNCRITFSEFRFMSTKEYLETELEADCYAFETCDDPLHYRVTCLTDGGDELECRVDVPSDSGADEAIRKAKDMLVEEYGEGLFTAEVGDELKIVCDGVTITYSDFEAELIDEFVRTHGKFTVFEKLTFTKSLTRPLYFENGKLKFEEG